jgi:hypothetical protein
MTEVLAALEKLSKKSAKLVDVIKAVRRKLVQPNEVRQLAQGIADIYFTSVHQALSDVEDRPGLSNDCEWSVRTLLQMTEEARDRDAYLGALSDLRTHVQEAMVCVLKAKGVRRLVVSETEKRILHTLQQILPASAGSYYQVLEDIAFSGKRISWRGTGTELREVLREVMHHLAPDDQVMAAPGFQLEADQKRPTQKQRVRFILKARRRGVEVAENSLDAVDELIANLARSTYTRGSATTHATTDATEVRHIKNYTDALLIELLEVGRN